MLKEQGPLTRDKFRETIYASEPDHIRDDEVDYLFDLLDYSKNHEIDRDDFRGGFDWAGQFVTNQSGESFVPTASLEYF